MLQDLAKKTVLLTGGSGDLGQTVAPLLLREGATVLSLDPVAGKLAGVEYIEGSILDVDTVSRSIERADVVVHIAAWHGFHAFTGSKTPAEFWDLNMTGTFNLLDACERSQVSRLVFISSTSVDEWPDMYGLTKQLGEDLCKAYAARGSVNVLVLRPRAFIPWWNRNVYSNFEDWATWFAKGAVHIDDVARGTAGACGFLAADRKGFFDVVELDGKHDFSGQDLEQWSAMGRNAFLKLRFPELSSVIDETSYLPETPPSYKDVSRAAEIFGYEPQYGYKELLLDMGARRNEA